MPHCPGEGQTAGPCGVKGSAASPGRASGRKEGGRAWWDPTRDPSLAVGDVGAGLVPGAA